MTAYTMKSEMTATMMSLPSRDFEMKLAKLALSIDSLRTDSSKKIMIFLRAVKKRYLKKKSSLASKILAQSLTIFASKSFRSS